MYERQNSHCGRAPGSGGHEWVRSRAAGNIQTLEARLQACSTERDQALAAAAAGKAALDEQRKSVTGLQTALDACLAREQTAVATADQWREIIASAQSRDMAPEEKGKVPDATTRQLLQESLDLPL